VRLVFETQGVIKEVERLKSLFELITGDAYPDERLEFENMAAH